MLTAERGWALLRKVVRGPPSDLLKFTHKDNGPPSDLLKFAHKDNGTFATKRIAHSNKAQGVHTTTKFEKEGGRQARSGIKNLSHFLLAIKMWKKLTSRNPSVQSNLLPFPNCCRRLVEQSLATWESFRFVRACKRAKRSCVGGREK